MVLLVVLLSPPLSPPSAHLTYSVKIEGSGEKTHHMTELIWMVLLVVLWSPPSAHLFWVRVLPHHKSCIFCEDRGGKKLTKLLSWRSAHRAE
jgi:hypothetical protein